MKILGISAFYHDSAAALISDGILVAAAQEERFTRIKHDFNFPENAVQYCLEAGNISAENLDAVVFYDKPLLKFERILATYTYNFPRALNAYYKAIPLWLRQKLWVPTEIRNHTGYQGQIYFTEHHESHAASSFFFSPFEEANIITIDGVGEWATATRGYGRGNKIELFDEINFPHSLGLLYSAFTYYLGFKVNSAEYKVMGLAPYGGPKYLDQFRELIHIYDDGSFHLNMKYFTYDRGLRMTSSPLEKLFGHPRRVDESETLEQFHKDVAMSLQTITEEVVLKMVTAMVAKTGNKNLCLAGGVALNCVANGRIIREAGIENIYIQPAAGDAGGAVGAAAFVYNQLFDHPRMAIMDKVYLGPEYSNSQIEEYLKTVGASYKKLDRADLLEKTADAIIDQRVIGWFQGRMEYGPRALGNRSILADARNRENMDRVNLKIKFRESFRPFAPSVLEDDIADYFELDRPSPYMLLVANVREDNRVIPAVTHVDGSARIQSVARSENELYYDLIAKFKEKTGVSVLINTSFNVRGEPIVATPEDAFRCFMTTKMDTLVMGSYMIEKENNPAETLAVDFQSQVAAD